MKTRIIFFASLLFLLSCKKKDVRNDVNYDNNYNTQNVVVIVIDGPRYSETWGDTAKTHIPNMANHLAPKGIIYDSFYNQGSTYTTPGYTSLLTGMYQPIGNGGQGSPYYPTIFQLYNRQYPEEISWLVTSKDKLEVLIDCQDPGWKGSHQPKHDCGIDGLGTGYRSDWITYNVAMDVLKNEQPRFIVIGFKEPDYSGHTANWANYIKGIERTDQYAKDIIDFLETDNFYKNRTTVFVTNDHGRHLDTIPGGFPSHGDGCDGCRHVNFYATGPDFYSDTIMSIPRENINLTPTIAELLHTPTPRMKGEVMWELFKEK